MRRPWSPVRIDARRPTRARAVRAAAGLTLLATAVVFAGSPPPALAASPDLVISQVYGGGGSALAVYANDFIEIHNTSASSVSLNGWSVQYASAGGAIWSTTNLTGTIAPGAYFLVSESGGAQGLPLPTPDATGSFPMSATAGKVALVANTTALNCLNSCTNNPNVRDFVGYGAGASSYEGTGPTAAPSSSTSALRNGSGSSDTDDNLADFSAGPPSPRNSSSPPWLSGVSGTITEVGTGSPIPGALLAALRTTDYSVAAGAVADASGDFAVVLPAGSYFLYLLDPSGAHAAGFHGPPTIVTVTAGNMTDADPVMNATRGSVTATITETGSGTPLGGVWALALSASVTNTGATEAAVVANGSGQVTVAGLRPGNHYVGFIDPTGTHTTRFWPNSPNVPDATQVAVSAGSATAADVSLPAQASTGTGSVISGTVTEQGTGTPLPGVHVVALRASDYSMVRGAVTNGSGEYSVDVAAGDYKLAILDSAGGHDMEWFDDLVSTDLANAVNVTAPGVANAALRTNTGTMTGTITDAMSGDPVLGTWVVAIGPSGIAGIAVTAADGTYTVTGLAPGVYRATFADPNGGRLQEYYDNSPDFTGATTINVAAAATATINATLSRPPP